jgi:oxygen-dependent protoporphyrinogen oxidase
VIGGIFKEPFRQRRAPEVEDESVGSFITRRFSPNLANNFISAILHGIYAGDIDCLSARSLMPNLWRDEALRGSIVRGALARNRLETYDDVALRAELYKPNLKLMERISDASVYSFRSGVTTLSCALEAELRRNHNIAIRTGAEVRNVGYDPARSGEAPFEIGVQKYSHVVSTLPAPVTNSLLPAAHRVPALAEIEAVTVLVVNLYFATPRLLPVTGFGYLLPKSLPVESNPHHALGVIFDSDATPQETEPGTKVTVMFGGHYWRERRTYPDAAEALEMARDVLRRHLGIEETPVATNVSLNRDCIPQYTVGHEDRLVEARDGLERLRGGFSVAGASYKGVGLNDCVRSARDVVKTLVEKGRGTGLERSGEVRWVDASTVPK